MGAFWTKDCSFITGVVRYSDLGYVSLIGDEESDKRLSQSIIVVWNGGNWLGEDDKVKAWETVDMTVARKPLEQALTLGENGEIYCIGSGDHHDEFVEPNRDPQRNPGPFRAINRIGDAVYAVGMGRQAFKREANGSWVAIDASIRPDPDDENVYGFEAIDGFDEREIYAVGWNGEIWRYDDSDWHQQISPTNFTLTDVCCAGDGTVYACGRMGLLLRGRGDEWEAIELGDFSGDIWSLAWFDSTLYFCTMDAVYSLEADDSIAVAEMGNDPATSCYKLSVAEGVMWSVGAKDIMSFDGKKWERID
jgi:hypothetical protein